MSFHIPAYNRPRIDRRFMFAPPIDRPGIDRRFMFAPPIDRPGIDRRFMFGPALRGVGQLSMPAETQAALKACSDKCDQQHGVPSGNPDFISLTTCFANCNLQHPPTAAMPGGGMVTPPPVGPTATLPPPEVQPPPPPPVEPEIEPAGPVAPTKASASGDMKMWVIGGAVAAVAVGAFLYFKKR